MAQYCITFSPTGGTRKVADILKQDFGGQWTDVDLLCAVPAVSLTAKDLCIVSVPSFGGRVPPLATTRLKALCGNGAKTVLVCVYGNRAYEDTLVELQDVLEECGFICMAAIAALAEHSIMHSFAAGRPDADDEQALTGFAKRIAQKIASGVDISLTLPGNRPYKEYKVAPMPPQAGDGCVACGECAARCPADAINPENPKETDAARCICCMACTAVCPLGVRSVDPVKVAALTERLRPMLEGRKENECFI